jgi:hypothetical protein
MSKIHRTTISIPLELKERMDAVTDQVNWSAIAARAFEAKLFEIQSRRGQTMNKADIVKRLKATKEQEREEEFEDGKKAGREWAQSDATAKELERLDKYITNTEDDWWTTTDSASRGLFVWAAWPSRREEYGATDDFWQQALGNDAHRIEDDDYFRGFGVGAVEAWLEVKNEV